MYEQRVLIVPYQDGPYLVRGPVLLRDQDGRPIETARRPMALCRCGKSRMRPFCDGTHRLVRFEAPSQPERAFEGSRGDPEPTRARASANASDSSRCPSTDPGGARAGLACSRDEGPMTAPARLVAARRGLGRAKEGLGSWLDNSALSAGEHSAMSSAEVLVDAACHLLGELDRPTRTMQSRIQEASGVRAPCSCLVRGALEALSPAASGSDVVPRLMSQLHAVLSLLGPEAGCP
jgi:CDGSH-type Zn-finger protein